MRTYNLAGAVESICGDVINDYRPKSMLDVMLPESRLTETRRLFAIFCDVDVKRWHVV